MVAIISSDDGPATEDDAIVREALENWKASQDWQGAEDERAREDIKFANGDARNAWQWPQNLYDTRTGGDDPLPCLTINNTRTHNDIIINAMSKNRHGIKIRPIGGKASYKSADVMQSLIHRIENISRASAQYRKVAEQQVDGGIGYIIIETDYISERSFNQDIYLKASRDPTGVCLDPGIKEPDGSDARFGHVFDTMSRKEFNRQYPQFKNKVGASPLSSEFTDWLSDNTITLVKYYRKRAVEDTLISYKTDDGEEVEKLASELKDDAGKDLYKMLVADIKAGTLDGRHRPVLNNEVEWFLIAGNQIVSRGKWAGKYIPICRCVGRELIINKTLDRKGHTRPLIDAQRMLNFAASTDVQVNALQPKAPWVASARAVEGQEQWKDANIKTYGVLLYNDIDDEAPPELQKIAPPQRLDPPRGNPGYQAAIQNAERQMMMVSGQFQAQMGENDTQSAASGKAIGERQQQGDLATYHFMEHQSDMFRLIGIQLLDLIPKIYDTNRALQILGGDGEKMWVKIDPDQTSALEEAKEEAEDEEAANIIFNPSVGVYECVSDPGPDDSTRRQEAWAAMSMILQNNKELAAVCADLLFKYGDFPGADKLMERLQKEIKATKPYLFDDKVEPQMLALQQQLKRLTDLNAELMQKLAMRDLSLKGRDERRDIEASRAETDRLKVMIEAVARLTLTPQQKAQMEHEIASSSHDATMQMIVDANAGEISQQAGNDASSGAEQ